MTPPDEQLSHVHNADKRWLRGNRWGIAVILIVAVVGAAVLAL